MAFTYSKKSHQKGNTEKEEEQAPHSDGSIQCYMTYRPHRSAQF